MRDLTSLKFSEIEIHDNNDCMLMLIHNIAYYKKKRQQTSQGGKKGSCQGGMKGSWNIKRQSKKKGEREDMD